MQYFSKRIKRFRIYAITFILTILNVIAPTICATTTLLQSSSSAANTTTSGITSTTVYSSTTDINECASTPCQNGGICTDGVNGYMCSCITGYNGTHCEIDINECDSIPCQNGGTCKDWVNGYTCDCLAGYTGPLCETDIFECASNPCRNGATCFDLVNEYTCSCLKGYTGIKCETNINECVSSPCHNGGTCVDGVNGYTCDCLTGYTGTSCEYDIDECASTPCQNGGTCANGVNGYTCSCITGYNGTNCEINIDDCALTPCQNGGKCTDRVNGYTCDCLAGYSGTLCENDIDECASTPCQNRGTCTDGVNRYTCSCITGYNGTNCEIDIDDCASTPCQNGGTCVDGVNGYTCDCLAGYTDTSCEYDVDECASKPCQNGGTCTDGVNGYSCSCLTGYNGTNCAIDIDDCASKPCQNNGTCIDGVNGYTCACLAGYTGTSCEYNIDECASTPCQNGGICTDGVNGYMCVCITGYNGSNCEIDIDDCYPYPWLSCLNNGTCIDLVNSFTCACVAGYTGAMCETARDCGPVPNISYGFINSTNTTFGSSADVTCNNGYKTSMPTIQCTANGTWEIPACTIVDCGSAPNISYGFVKAYNTTFGASASVTCNIGYNTTLPIIHCTANGTWDVPSCAIIDCGTIPSISHGFVNANSTTYDSSANVTCNTGYNTSKPVIRCTANGTWGESTCTIVDCGLPKEPLPANVKLEPPKTTTYGSRAVYSCYDGYSIAGNAIRECLTNGSWSSIVPTCRIKDCGNVIGTVENGMISYTTNTTTYGSTVQFKCKDDYTLIGVSLINCTKLGIWSGLTPTCHKNRPRTCPADTDSRGTVWTETSINSTALQTCADGFSGNITRRCTLDGVWLVPQYNCVRESVKAVNDKIGNLSKNATEDDLNDALSAITTETTRSQNSTDDQKLTDGELSLLTSALDTVAGVLSSSSVKITENISNSFVDSASNLIDGTNKESWKALSSTNNGAEKVLSAVDSLGEALAKSLEGGEDKKTVVKKNIALEVKKISNDTVVFPVRSTNTSDTEDTNWITESQSQVQLDPIALKDSVNVLATAVMYRDMSDILSSKRSSGNGSEEEHEERINGPILALSILPEFNSTLDPPVTIKFEHQLKNFSSPQCSYWSFQTNSQGFWSGDGCKVNSTNASMTVCTCDHLTNFAVLMSPFRPDNKTPKALRIISIIGICFSIVCLITTFVVHFVLWRYLRNDRTTVLMNLCVALLLSYIIFLTGVDRTESNVACTIIAAILHYMYLVVFCVMLVEGILIVSMVLFVFGTKYRVKLLLGIAWALPAVIVGISLGASETLGYGNTSVCWLATDNGLIWAFVGPALLIITVNVACLLVVIRALFRTKAMLSKTAYEKAKTSLRSLAVLVPLMGISWIVGIFYVDESVDIIQYIFAILNGLQGVFIFMFHCLLNDHVKKGIRLWKRKKSWTWVKSTSGNTSNKYKDSNELRETDKSNFDNSEDNSRSYSNWREKALEYSYPKSLHRTKHSPAELSNPTYKYIGEDRSRSIPQYSQM